MSVSNFSPPDPPATVDDAMDSAHLPFCALEPVSAISLQSMHLLINMLPRHTNVWFPSWLQLLNGKAGDRQ